jgi:hypothetical protein
MIIDREFPLNCESDTDNKYKCLAELEFGTARGR